MPVLLKSFLFSFIVVSAEAKIFSPVVGMNSTSVTASDAAYTKPQNGLGFSTGVVIYDDSKWEDTYFRYSGMLERKKFFFDTQNTRRKYEHMTVGLQAGIVYRFAEIFWPFIGFGAGWSGRDECTYQDVDCGTNKFEPLFATSQIGIALGAAENFKWEIIIENQLLEVDSRWDKYRTVTVLLHFFPDQN